MSSPTSGRVRDLPSSLRVAVLFAALIVPAGCVFFGDEDPDRTGELLPPEITIDIQHIAVEVGQAGEEIAAHVTWEGTADQELPADSPPPTFTVFAALQDNLELIRSAIQATAMSIAVTVNTRSSRGSANSRCPRPGARR